MLDCMPRLVLPTPPTNTFEKSLMHIAAIPIKGLNSIFKVEFLPKAYHFLIIVLLKNHKSNFVMSDFQPRHMHVILSLTYRERGQNSLYVSPW